MIVFVRTFFMVLLMELGSASNFTLAAISAHSKSILPVWLGGLSAMMLTCFLAIRFGNYMNRLPVHPDLISGVILTTMGIFFLWRAK